MNLLYDKRDTLRKHVRDIKSWLDYYQPIRMFARIGSKIVVKIVMIFSKLRGHLL